MTRPGDHIAKELVKFIENGKLKILSFGDRRSHPFSHSRIKFGEKMSQISKDKVFGFLERLTSKQKLSKKKRRLLAQRLIVCALNCLECAIEISREASTPARATRRIARQTADVCFKLANQVIGSSDISNDVIKSCERQCRICSDNFAKQSTTTFVQGTINCVACADVCNASY